MKTIGGLAAMAPALPEQLLGKLGRQLWEYANGLDMAAASPPNRCILPVMSSQLSSMPKGSTRSVYCP